MLASKILPCSFMSTKFVLIGWTICVHALMHPIKLYLNIPYKIQEHGWTQFNLISTLKPWSLDIVTVWGTGICGSKYKPFSKMYLLLIFRMSVCLPVCMCTAHMHDAFHSQKWAFYHLELELNMDVSSHVSAWNEMRVLW